MIIESNTSYKGVEFTGSIFELLRTSYMKFDSKSFHTLFPTLKDKLGKEIEKKHPFKIVPGNARSLLLP